ncbi:MAG: FAD binding domain-containing protein [Planctomycetota bacterium]
MRDRLVFYVNGRRHEARGRHASLTLSDYLRSGAGDDAERMTGTKIACAEGDCGACTVLVGEPDGERLVYRPIDACIAFVYQLDRRHVVTVEGVGACGSLSRVQAAMVGNHGSQCGFCTPGFVMAMHGVLETHAGEVSEDDWRLGLSGNLCRCTGYEQILEAANQAADDERTGVGERFDEAAILADFNRLGDGPVAVNIPGASQSNGHAAAGVRVTVPTTLSELLEARAADPSAKLVAGATDVGVQFNHGKIDPQAVIVTTRVSELQRMEVNDGVLTIGAGVSWSRIESLTKKRLPEYHRILTRFGSPQVRIAGTLAGNLANASPIADSIPLHYVTESTIEVASVGGARRVPIADFYRGYKDLDLAPDELITAIHTPLLGEDVRLKLYKISKRRDMDISTVTLGVWLRMAGETISEARLAAGGVGPTVMRLPRAEAALAGEAFTIESLRAAGQIAAEEVTPITDVRGGAGYRRQLVANLLVKAYHDLLREPALNPVG